MGKPLRYYSDTWKQGYYFCLGWNPVSMEKYLSKHGIKEDLHDGSEGGCWFE